MTQTKKDEITEIAKEFASGFDWPINGSGWLIVDPLSGYLNSVGIVNELGQYPATDKCPQVLVMTFPDGSRFIPAGGDLKPIDDRFENYLWF